MSLSKARARRSSWSDLKPGAVTVIEANFRLDAADIALLPPGFDSCIPTSTTRRGTTLKAAVFFFHGDRPDGGFITSGVYTDNKASAQPRNAENLAKVNRVPYWPTAHRAGATRGCPPKRPSS